MRAAIFTFTNKGALKGERLSEFLNREGFETALYPAGKDFQCIVGDEFSRCRLMVFIGALGIAVRAIAPYLRDKTTDPAVICMDEAGKHVISVLSGHVGGANMFAEQIADLFGGTAVITTATDVNGVFAVDQWAVSRGLIIADKENIKRVSKALLENETVGFHTDYCMTGDLPDGVAEDIKCKSGIAVSLRADIKPFEYTLNLLPRILHVGIGCRKNTPAPEIELAVKSAFEESGFDIRCICRVSSIDLKKSEFGLLLFAERLNLPLAFYSAEELTKAEGRFSGSDFVKSVTSTDNVCERAASLSSGGGRFVLKKTVKNGITVAAAEEDFNIYF